MQEQKFSSVLRAQTRKAHSIAENVDFIKGFIRGTVNKASYCKLLASFYYIYQSMEDALFLHREHPAIATIYFEELIRKSSIEEDLAFFLGPTWSEQILPSAATCSYVKRIEAVSKEEPVLLIAHSSVRYLGDLSGGQILKKIVQRSLKLPGEQGTVFYEFENICDYKAFKIAYKRALDELPIDAHERQGIIAEANRVFHLNINVFKELEGNVVKALASTIIPSFPHL